jgi:outer membrane protein OmpA-like peptidoglycan-associated protein
MRNLIMTTLLTLAAASSSALARDHKPIDPFDEDVVFANDSVELSSADVSQVAATATWLKAHPRLRIVLEGHADKTGPASYNADLATRRLEVVRDRLTRAGIATDRIVLVVFGEAESSQGQVNHLDRRVIMWATAAPATEIAAGSLDHRKAISVVWTRRGTLFTERRGITDSGVSARR